MTGARVIPGLVRSSPRGSARRLLLLSLLPLWLVCASAEAQLPAQVQVRWRGPASCPRSEQFDRELARLLGNKRAQVEASDIVVTVRELTTPEATTARFQLHLALSLDDEQSEREVELASCRDVRHTAALLVATAVELRASEANETVPDPRDPRELRWAAQLGLLGDLGSLPGPSAGPNLGVHYTRGRMRLWSEARYLLPRDERDDASALVGRLDLFAGALGAGYLWQLGALSVGPSLELELGYLRARGRGEQALDSTGAIWGSALLGLVGEYQVEERVTLALSAQLGLPLWRPQFTLENEAPFYTTSGAAFRLGLSVRVKLGFKNPRDVGQ